MNDVESHPYYDGSHEGAGLSAASEALRTRCISAVRDENALRDALQTADIVPQLLVEAQLSGRYDLCEEASGHIRGGWNSLQQIPEDMRARIRSRLVDTLKKASLPGGEAALAKPSPARFGRLMTVGVGQPVPDDYVTMLLEEQNEGAPDPRSVQWRRDVSKLNRSERMTVIVGAGLSGICMGIKMKEAGLPFIIIEKDSAAGGTWYENDYPGSGVDIPSPFYSFSFETNPSWSHLFANREELWRYLEACIDKYGIRENIRFNQEVVRARYDEVRARWTVEVKTEAGRIDEIEASILISGVGQLNRPSIPKISGLESFKGPVFHTAQWDHTVNLGGLRVALIGTGASSMQVAPTIAPSLKKLVIFQRSPHWASFNAEYHRAIPEGMKWAMRNIPYYAKWCRALLFWASGDLLHTSLQRDPNWPHPDISLNVLNHQMRENLIAHIQSELAERPDLIEKVIPTYPPYGKRMLRDNYWYRLLKLDNVELHTGGIRQVTADTIIDSDGKEHQIDAIILGTGFQASRMLWPMEIIGRNGASIRDLWGEDDPRAYLGISVPQFPNFFILFGPNTTLSHGGSLFFHAECQVRYIMQCIRELVETDRSAMECRPAVYEEYNRRVDEAHARMVWTHSGVTNWYKNKKGRVFSLSPWRLVDYWKLTYALNPADYAFEGST